MAHFTALRTTVGKQLDMGIQMKRTDSS